MGKQVYKIFIFFFFFQKTGTLQCIFLKGVRVKFFGEKSPKNSIRPFILGIGNFEEKTDSTEHNSNV